MTPVLTDRRGVCRVCHRLARTVDDAGRFLHPLCAEKDTP